MKVADFSIIKEWTVEVHDTEHNRDLQWLQEELRKVSLEAESRDVVVFTHHAPSFLKTAEPRHKSDPWRYAFCSDLIESQVRSWQGANAIHSWIFGHTHWNTAFRYRGISITSNQYKYNSRNPPRPGILNSWFKRPTKHFAMTDVVKV